MRVIRFFYPNSLQEQAQIILDGDAFHHAIHVLRCKKGSQLELFNGEGLQANGEILSLDRRTATIFLEKVSMVNNESSLNTILIQGISKGERMDYCLQKATELGVSAVYPVITEYCNVQLKDSQWEKRMMHWSKVMISACEQCGRNSIPKLAPPMPLFDALNALREQHAIYLLHPTNSQPFNLAKPKNNAIGFVVGPEGGFSEDEVDHIMSIGISSLKLGPRILRSETCGVVALSIAQSLWGDFNKA